MTKSRRQRLDKIGRSFDVLWCALMDLRKHDGHTLDFHQATGSALNYLNRLAKRAPLSYGQIHSR